ncbi:uncharacterized protein ACA1_389040 [Acanthamoeba castellanii str. Neff]|uniref:Uncharacterized protein n=1 Tax=Acanthamoeba castellanii (strain ATCC 30010 / Neff) TaxID=1257118 RepID=L8GEP6_ACACF|nr:uncharacterized protein ACA1_389040 [Acanthamoeba castellanii str. Neff]ELR11193.1 hypothetical protein ACA1_389040 [Acanthamoeba castellanii str. Neff]
MWRLPAVLLSSSVLAAVVMVKTEEESEWHQVLAMYWKVMVWNVWTWALLCVFNMSEDIHDWHTLTYCVLQLCGDKLCCVTQNCWYSSLLLPLLFASILHSSDIVLCVLCVVL